MVSKSILSAIAAMVLLSSPVSAYQRHHFGGHHHRGWGWAGPAIVGGIVIGGALTAAAIAERRASAASMRRCALDFPTFEPASGTFVDGAGVVKICPYLY